MRRSRRGIARALAAHGFSGQGTGVAVADIATGEVIYQRNGARPLLPASTEKLFTTVGALSTLRPDFRFATTVVGVGTRAGPTWKGDLYLVGSGDPTFSSYDIAALAAQVKARGIRRISGRIRGDETVFDALALGAVAGALHRRRVAAALGARARPRRHGQRQGRRQPAAQRGTRAAPGARRSRRPGRRPLRGRRQGARRAPSSSAACSPMPLWRIVRFMDRHSDNFTAEMVAKAIGAYAGGSGTTARGMHVAGEVAAPMLGDDASLVHLADGSGLSHANRTTAGGAREAARGGRRQSGDRASRSPGRSASPAPTARSRTACPRCAAACSARAARSTTSRRSPATSRASSGRRFSFAVLMNVPALSDWDAHATQDAIVTLLAKR